MALRTLDITQSRCYASSCAGGMAERLNAAVLKTAEGASPPGVRIPLPPPAGNSHMLAVALLCGQRVFSCRAI